VVAEFADRRLNWVNLPHHVGSQSGPNNEGLRRARGNYIAYLGHDDLWFPEHLASLVTTIEQAAVDFVHAVTVCIAPAGPVWAIGAPGTRRSYANRFIPPSSWLHRRELFDSCGVWPDPEGQIAGVDFVYHRRAFLAGQRFAGSNQVSVIKFPAWLWRIYALRAGHPQPAYLARMRQDPRQLREELLQELVFSYTRRREDRPLRQSCIGAVRAVIEPIKDWYGLDRWPLSQCLIWKTKLMRKRGRLLKGLPPLVKPPRDEAPAKAKRLTSF
jgi:glycosyltransferase involved in cell wall biosynthesis